MFRAQPGDETDHAMGCSFIDIDCETTPSVT
jgi:hypothetical protein